MTYDQVCPVCLLEVCECPHPDCSPPRGRKARRPKRTAGIEPCGDTCSRCSAPLLTRAHLCGLCTEELGLDGQVAA